MIEGEVDILWKTTQTFAGSSVASKFVVGQLILNGVLV